IPRAKKNVDEIKALLAKSDRLFLATDPDREGESIAWHLAQLLDPEPGSVKRIAFHEITKTAVLKALENARELDISLVEAQQARRVLDRLVGYKLSPLLWAKVSKGLSAGRVQSVAVRLVVERAAEIAGFAVEDFCRLKVKLEKPGVPPVFEAKLTQWQGKPVERSRTMQLFAEEYQVSSTCFPGEEETRPVSSAIEKGPLTVLRVETKETRQRPKPPFITSTLQQDAIRKLRFSSQKTMMVAQELYEGIPLEEGDVVGLITYMRTDSFNVSADIQAESAEYIKQTYGQEFLPPSPRMYETKVKGAQEAHEAIHPTSVARRPENIKKYLTHDQALLYELIWKRFMASQMADAVFDTTVAEISIGETASPSGLLRATGRVLKFEGHLKLQTEDLQDKEDDEKENDDEEMLPALSQGDALKLAELKAAMHKTSPPPLYNEASLIKTLEKHGIGRPSTYAPIIKTIQDRKYISRQPKTGRLTATDLGVVVTEKLKKFFPNIMDISYTANVEEGLDDIAESKKKWVDVVRGFYDPFVKELNEAYDSMEGPVAEKSDEPCPVCKGPMLLRQSRFGKYLSCARFPKCKGKVRLDSEGKKVVPELTSEVCDKCGKPLVIRVGRRGRFLACSGYPDCKTTYSVGPDGKKSSQPATVMTDEKCGKCGSPLVLRNGRRGYFLACSAYPKCKNIVETSEEKIQAILAKATGGKA
ncbi:MAG: type I DNA topoisomerase, partial [Elusimicrobia bacterium]|nr:type I DNA topoisomerase [Elusimicrobiota bacterium]